MKLLSTIMTVMVVFIGSLGFSGCVSRAEFIKLQEDTNVELVKLQEDLNEAKRAQSIGLAALERNVNSAIGSLESKTHSSINDLDLKLISRINNLDSAINLEINALKEKIESEAKLRDELLANYCTKKEIENLNLQITAKMKELEIDKISIAECEKSISALDIPKIRREIAMLAYELENQKTEFLSGVSIGYRNAMGAVRGGVVGIEPMISEIINEGGKCSLFVRDFRSLDGNVTSLGDLLSREFTACLKARTGFDNLYREEYVINLYQQKKLAIPTSEAFNLDNLEKSGFPTERVLIISGKITPLARNYRLDIDVTDLKDPQYRSSISRLIPRDSDIDIMNKTILKKLSFSE
ncbi:MAG: hypothetical protein K9M57_10170 [Phycisphaerae bacterium]|nr:hypothetical protein [Phycisphaerae bacterium]